MARQPRSSSPSEAEHTVDVDPNVGVSRPLGGGAQVTTLSNNPIESVPEVPGTVTEAAARALDDAYSRGNAKALATKAPSAAPPPKYYRVVADVTIRGNAGFRGRLRAGKVLNDHQYNIDSLKAQGVRLTEADASEAF